MKPKIITLVLALLVFLGGCGQGAEKKERKEQLFPPGQRYSVALTVEENTSQGEIFFSEGGVLHFLHTDADSPLFRMEEVFFEDKHVTIFQGMQYEASLSHRGNALLFPLVHTLRAKEPSKTKKEENKKVLSFKDENVHALVTLDESGNILTIDAVVYDKTVKITFREGA